MWAISEFWLLKSDWMPLKRYCGIVPYPLGGDAIPEHESRREDTEAGVEVDGGQEVAVCPETRWYSTKEHMTEEEHIQNMVPGQD